jgi:hypothetical protein
VLAEVVDIPKTFNSVYGIGPGTKLDAEISVYMKSQGWPVRVQVYNGMFRKSSDIVDIYNASTIDQYAHF